MPCVFGPINRGSFGPNGRFPGTFWPKLSLLGCLRSLKKNWVKNLVAKIFVAFSKFWGFVPVLRPTIGSRPRSAPKTTQKPPRQAKKRVLVITLARGGVTGRSSPPFACTMGVFDRFRRVRDPNGTILTTFGPPAGRARNFFRSGVPGVPNFFPQKIFLFKNDIHWVLSGFRAQKTHFGPLWTPQKGLFWPILHTK